MTVAILAAGGSAGLVTDLFFLLAAAGIVALAMRLLKLDAAPGYIIAGALIGPSAFGVIGSVEQVETLSSLALLLLMFSIGLHLDLSAFRTGARSLIIAGVLSVLLCTAALTPIAMLFGLGFNAALAVAMALALSSTALVLRELRARRQLSTRTGRLSVAILLIQDLAAPGMLILLPVLAPSGEDSDVSAFSLALTALLSGAALLVFFISARVLAPRILALAARAKSPELLLVLGAALAIGSAAVTTLAGLSPELGAFLGGLVVGATPFRSYVAGRVTDLSDLFMVVFLTSVGMVLDLAAVMEFWWIVPIGVAVLLIVKWIAITLSAWAAGAGSSASGSAGACLAQGGEFSLLVLFGAISVGLLGSRDAALVTSIIVASLIATPALVITVAPWVGHLMARTPPPPWARGSAGLEEASEEAPSRVVIGGFGPVGRAVAERLDKDRVPYSIVELNHKTVAKQRELGRRAMYGDVTNAPVLEAAGARHAAAVILTLPDDQAMLRACQAARRLAPGAFIGCRAGVLSAGMTAKQAGANFVTIEEIAAGQQLANATIEHLASAKRPDAAPPTPDSVQES